MDEVFIAYNSKGIVSQSCEIVSTYKYLLRGQLRSSITLIPPNTKL